MDLYEETLDPSEYKDFAYDWSSKLGDGETITSQTVTFINAAGTTNPSNTVASPISRVWLTGGTHGQRAIFVILAQTSGGRTLETNPALAVDVVDNSIGPTAETDVERLTRLISEAEDQRALVATGKAVVEVWRNGRRVTMKVASLSELNEHLMNLRRELAEATSAAAGTPRRRAFGIAWRN